LGLRGDEDVLDLGCGSGLMLLGPAARLTTGSATGIDLWRSHDEAGSSRSQCQDNSARLGLAAVRCSRYVRGIFPPARTVTATRPN
jgi:cyclopropane fatty-acyl-phospholipid synthase-like methyltransferase